MDREVVVSLDNDYFVTIFEQSDDMTEDDFYEAVVDYVLRNIQIEIR